MAINYEALGRYVSAEEQVQSLLAQQTLLSDQIEVLLTRTRNSYLGTKSVRTVETAKVMQLSEQLNNVHAELMAMIEEVNCYAGDANKPRIKVV